MQALRQYPNRWRHPDDICPIGAQRIAAAVKGQSAVMSAKLKAENAPTGKAGVHFLLKV